MRWFRTLFEGEPRESTAYEDGVKDGIKLATARLGGGAWPAGGRWCGARRRVARAFDARLLTFLRPPLT